MRRADHHNLLYTPEQSSSGIVSGMLGGLRAGSGVSHSESIRHAFEGDETGPEIGESGGIQLLLW
jgi:hypothetical protein